MERKDKLAVFQTWAESGRKWSSVMDAKAGFVSAFGAALLAFLWNALNLPILIGWAKFFGVSSFLFALSAVFSALLVILPRARLTDIFGQGMKYSDDFKPLSFYSYVAMNFPRGSDKKFIDLAASMNLEDFERECLEQHFTISHVVNMKAAWIRRAVTCLGVAILSAGIASLTVLHAVN